MEGTMQSTYFREYINAGQAFYIDNRIGTPTLDRPEPYRPDDGPWADEIGDVAQNEAGEETAEYEEQDDTDYVMEE